MPATFFRRAATYGGQVRPSRFVGATRGALGNGKRAGVAVYLAVSNARMQPARVAGALPYINRG
ncbi:hypothetical protein WKR88_25675 [Trinickia caryophylli]|uniref:hypothetical protein n=1 Tax=Trinickia caryophylli TaxID=28094 RepID=UPI000A161F85|nr:hypothetical protein [Trinickia caryophylli]PMS13316.1 hypothetical protein C0Z17_05910 [Trinickia caryophylli]TRX19156.1 hypothetical protein FNF07_13560 [Trinickia caryophylli]WQE13547.1 hypothetical protein U0034_09370 [Trinickia caryophylli]GLU33919.1 hypothetical protein Busp01_37610 [Trinickia caryophylli]